MVFEQVDEREVDHLVERMKKVVERNRSTAANEERQNRMDRIAEEIRLRYK